MEDLTTVKHLIWEESFSGREDEFPSLVYIHIRSSLEEEFTWRRPLKVLRLETNHPIRVNLHSLEELVIETSQPIHLNVSPKMVISSGVVKKPNITLEDDSVVYDRRCLEAAPGNIWTGSASKYSIGSLPGTGEILSGAVWRRREDLMFVEGKCVRKEYVTESPPDTFTITLSTHENPSAKITLEEFSHLTNLQRYLYDSEVQEIDGKRTLLKNVNIGLWDVFRFNDEKKRNLALNRLVSWLPDYHRRVSWYPDGKITPSWKTLGVFGGKTKYLLAVAKWAGFLSLEEELKRIGQFIHG